MSLLGKFMNTMRLSDDEDEDYFLDDDYEDENRRRKGSFPEITVMTRRRRKNLPLSVPSS